MTALELIALVTQVLFIGLFLVVLWHALRQPTRWRLDTVLLFGSITLVVLLGEVLDRFGLGDEPWAGNASLMLINVAPFAMIRLVDDFSGVPSWVRVASGVAFAAILALSLVTIASPPTLVELASLAWFPIVGGFAAVAFAREVPVSHGITRNRMLAVAVGAGLFVALIVVALLATLVPGEDDWLGGIGQAMALLSVLAFFLGFAPPTWVRRAWREPDLRRFLERSIHMTGIHDDREAVVELQRAAADTFGAHGAAIGVADPDRSILRYVGADGEWVEYPDDRFIGGRSFTGQRRIVAVDAARVDPEEAEVYERAGASTVIAAPVNAEGGRRIGVLAVYAERAPVFIEDDLWLLELMADQTAVLLEARQLTTQVGDVRAREEAARLKEEFLSVAAHDLRTPLTVVLGQAELMERRLSRDPNAPIDPAGVSRIAKEARHLRDLVSELLDAQRLEQGLTVMDLAPADVRNLVETICDRHREHGVPLALTAPDVPLVASIDRPRIEQVVENLLENALKYGADDEAPQVRITHDADEVRVAVIDHGAGIPEAERERIFERFYRASNAQSVTDTGMGLGLYICRRIVEDHGGRIWAEPTPEGGATFVVALPLLPATTPATAAPGIASDAAPRSQIGPAGQEAAADA
jgi:signal transduction histidine kinase